MDNILYKLDNIKDFVTKNEIENCKKDLKLDIDEMVENVQRNFEEQIEIIKQNCEKLIVKYKNSYIKENEKIKNTIKVILVFWFIIIFIILLGVIWRN